MAATMRVKLGRILIDMEKAFKLSQAVKSTRARIAAIKDMVTVRFLPKVCS